MTDWRIINELKELSSSSWETLDYQQNPFLSFSFLSGLEKHNCLDHQCWQPSHIVIEEDTNIIGFMPLYIKEDSYGEFVFDWAWADAYQRAGRRYYPKLVSAIPFTPASGPRFLVNKNKNKKSIENKLISAALELMNDNSFSSLHVLFPNKNSLEFTNKNYGMQRLTCQYHWFNNNYRDFQDFLETLTSKKRKQILKERRAILEDKIEIERLEGKSITSAHWEIFYRFYCATFYKNWGEPRLTLDFFKSLSEELTNQTLLILAKKDDAYIAGAFAMLDQNTLYGRHWGCISQRPFLHFELCYYQTIEYVIENKMHKLDAGVQGEHKLARGFLPIAMPSYHWIRENDFRSAIDNYLERESEVMHEHIDMLNTHLPYKNK